MESVMNICVLTTFFSVVMLICLTLWRWWQEDYAEEESDMSHSWSCDYCGTVVEATTIENLIDGYRIHNEAIYCAGEENEESEFRDDI